MQQAAKIVDVLHDQRAVIAGRVDALLEFGGCQAPPKAAEIGSPVARITKNTMVTRMKTVGI